MIKFETDKARKIVLAQATLLTIRLEAQQTGQMNMIKMNKLEKQLQELLEDFIPDRNGPAVLSSEIPLGVMGECTLGRDQHTGAEILRRYTRPDND